jgi:hypothetical protein
METTYSISDMRINALANRIKKLSRKAVKLGGKPFELVIGESQMVDRDGLAMTYWSVSLRGGGEVPVIDGWKFMARLQHLPGGNIVRSVPGALGDGQGVPEVYRERRFCDHCQTVRRRLDTYLLQNVHDGEWKQVGSTCVNDFTGHPDPEALIDAYTCLLDAIDEMSEDERFDPFAASDCYESGHIHAATYLAYVLDGIRKHGWVSSGKAKDDPSLCPTWLSAFAAFKDGRGRKGKPSAEDCDQVEPCLLWVRDILARKDSLNDYQHNLVVVLAGDWLPYDVLPLAASVIPVWKRMMDRLREADASPSKFQGEVGKRYDFVLTMQYHWASEPGQWGVSHLHKFTDGGGNVFVWWTGRKACEEGRTYRVRGTVKDHQEYQGIEQTVLTRCKAEEVQDATT